MQNTSFPISITTYNEVDMVGNVQTENKIYIKRGSKLCTRRGLVGDMVTWGGVIRLGFPWVLRKSVYILMPCLDRFLSLFCSIFIKSMRGLQKSYDLYWIQIQIQIFYTVFFYKKYFTPLSNILFNTFLTFTLWLFCSLSRDWYPILDT